MELRLLGYASERVTLRRSFFVYNPLVLSRVIEPTLSHFLKQLIKNIQCKNKELKATLLKNKIIQTGSVAQW